MKPPITTVLKALAPGIDLDDSPHGWAPIRCPFHGDTAASASYNTVLQRFRCHKCGDAVSGDGFDLIMGVEKCHFQDAKSRVVEITGATDFASSLTAQQPQRSKLTSRRTAQRSKLIRSKYHKHP